MELKFTQFSKAPATRTNVCSRCGNRMFQTKRLFWVCGPGCDGAEQWHQVQDASHMPEVYSIGKKKSLADQSMN